MNGPEFWNEIYERIPNGLIAGGCVRDHLLGLPPKDIDVFIHPQWLAGIDQAPPADFVFVGNGGREDYEGRDIRSIRDYTYRGQPVQLIFKVIPLKNNQGEYRYMSDSFTRREAGRQLAKTFPEGLVRMWYDGTAVRRTKQATEDLLGRKVTLMKDTWERSRQRVNRWYERNLGVDVPREESQWFINGLTLEDFLLTNPKGFPQQ